MQATQAVLHQNVLPCVTAPGLNWLVTRICRAQIEGMLHDLKQEIGRLDRGEGMAVVDRPGCGG